MVEDQTVNKGVIRADNYTVNIPKFYTVVKEKIEKIDYDFKEKTQERETTQYGDLMVFEFTGSKEVNEFVKKSMEIKMRFEKIKRNSCNIKINYKFKLHYDYKNRWDKTKLQRFLLHLYLRYLMKDKLKKTFFVPTLLDSEKLVKYLKQKLDMYAK